MIQNMIKITHSNNIAQSAFGALELTFLGTARLTLAGQLPIIIAALPSA
jgi:hypothetical protein